MYWRAGIRWAPEHSYQPSAVGRIPASARHICRGMALQRPAKRLAFGVMTVNLLHPPLLRTISKPITISTSVKAFRGRKSLPYTSNGTSGFLPSMRGDTRLIRVAIGR